MTVVETFRSTDSGDERRRDNRAQVGESSSADGQGARRVGDGVVDGVIREAEFGLDVAYVQAKQLDPNEGVRLSGVRDFVGGLEGPSGLSHFGNFVRWKHSARHLPQPKHQEGHPVDYGVRRFASDPGRSRKPNAPSP